MSFQSNNCFVLSFNWNSSSHGNGAIENELMALFYPCLHRGLPKARSQHGKTDFWRLLAESGNLHELNIKRQVFTCQRMIGIQRHFRLGHIGNDYRDRTTRTLTDFELHAYI